MVEQVPVRSCVPRGASIDLVLEPSATEVRAWAWAHGLAVADRGRITREVLDAFARRTSEADRTWLAGPAEQ